MSAIAAAAVATAVVVGTSAYTSGKRASSQAGEQADLSQAEIDSANKALKALGPVKAGKEKVAAGEFQFGLKNLSVETGIAKEDLSEQLGEQVQKSGLVTSGVERKRSTMWKRLESGFSRGQEGLLAQLGKSMGGVEEWYEGEKSRLEGVKKRANIQMGASSDRAGDWYLGKNV